MPSASDCGTFPKLSTLYWLCPDFLVLIVAQCPFPKTLLSQCLPLACAFTASSSTSALNYQPLHVWYCLADHWLHRLPWSSGQTAIQHIETSEEKRGREKIRGYRERMTCGLHCFSFLFLRDLHVVLSFFFLTMMPHEHHKGATSDEDWIRVPFQVRPLCKNTKEVNLHWF